MVKPVISPATDEVVGLQLAQSRLLNEEKGLYKFNTDTAALHMLAVDTPAPWKNYFFNDEYYLEVDQHGQAQACVTDGVIRALSSEYRLFYLKDEISGQVWNLTSQLLTASHVSCEAIHETSHSQYRCVINELEANITVFVPLAGACELWKVMLFNNSDEERQLSLYSVFSFENDALMKTRSWYDATQETCYADYFPHHHAYGDYAALKERKTLNYLFSTSPPIDAEAGKQSFFGASRLSEIPAAIQRSECSGETRVMDTPLGALHHGFMMAAGQSVEVGFCYGVSGSEAQVQQRHLEYGTTGKIDHALEAVSIEQQTVSSRLKIRTPDPVLDTFVNHWLHKQIMFQSRKNRMSHAFPIRNQLQDCMGMSLLDPDLAAKYILTRVCLQQENGYLRQWWSEGDLSNHSLCELDFKDAGIWLILCSIIVAYQSGSLALMEEEVSFYQSEESASVFEHLMRAARYLAEHRGSHGLCLFGDGDWTDPINAPGRAGKGESTWTTCALGKAIQALSEVASALGKTEECAWLDLLDASLSKSIQTQAWDGEWFVVGFDDHGKAFGTAGDQEGKIFLNSQTWAITAGYVNEEHLPVLLDSIDRLQTKCGTRLVWPEFSTWNSTWGRISLKQPGTTENGSIYCHAGMFKSFADCYLGRGNEALEEILRVMPSNPNNPPSSNLQAPIYIPNYYFGLEASAEFGVSSGNHHTGTAPWMLLVLVEYILGIRATADGLLVNPQLPDDWPEASLTRKFRDSEYHIAILNDRKGGDLEILVDNETVESCVLPHGNPQYQVIIIT